MTMINVSAAVAFIFSIFSANAIDITIKKPVYRGNTGFKLSEIVTIKTDKNKANLNNLFIPWPENKSWLTQSDIREIVNESEILDNIDFTVSGLNQVWLKQCFKPDEVTLLTSLKMSINNELAIYNARLTDIEIVDEQLCFTTKNDTLKAQDINNKYWLQKQRLNLLNHNNEKVSLLLKLSYEQEQVVANRFISIGEHIHNKDYERNWNAVSRVSMEQTITSINGFKALQEIDKGTQLNRDNVKPFPEIIKGDWVKLQLKKNGFFIEAKAKALTDGYLGKELDVILEKGSKVLTTKVVKKGVVSVSF